MRLILYLLVIHSLMVTTALSRTLVLETVVSGLSNPLYVTHAGDGSGRLFIVLQGGRIRIHDGTSLLAVPFLDISSRVSATGEQGLLGLAFHPDYANNGFFYVNYTDLAGDTVISRFSVSANPDTADAGSEEVVLQIVQPFTNHNAGQLSFGPNGYLYIGSGDGGSSGDPQNRAQDLSSLLGKLLRIDVDAGSPYAIPADNPFVGNPAAADEIWAYGLRNPWRFSFDRSSGDLFIGDVGQDAWEEVDFQPFSSTGGENYGWRLMEGTQCFNPPFNCNDGSLTLPIIEYGRASGRSITGGYRYRGVNIPDMQGLYIYGDFVTGKIWAADEDPQGGWSVEEILDSEWKISTFGEDESGEVYIAHYSAVSGRILRIVDLIPSPPTNSSGCFIDTVITATREKSNQSRKEGLP